MRKLFWLYLTFSAVMVACALVISLCLISSIMSRTPPAFVGNLSLICVLAVLVPYQASNFAKKRIMTLAADGSDGARVATPQWVRVIDRIVTAVVVFYTLVLIATLVLTFKGWFAS